MKSFLVLAAVLLSGCSALNAEMEVLAQMTSQMDSSLEFEVKTPKHLKGVYRSPESGAEYEFNFYEHPRVAAGQEKTGDQLVSYHLSKDGKNVITEHMHGVYNDLNEADNELKTAYVKTQIEDQHLHNHRAGKGHNPTVHLKHAHTGVVVETDKSYNGIRNEHFSNKKYDDIAVLSFALAHHGVTAAKYPIAMWAHQVSLGTAHGNDHIDTENYVQFTTATGKVETAEDHKAISELEFDFKVESELDEDEAIALLQDEDVSNEALPWVEDETDMQTGWSWRRRRRAHCGNVKTLHCNGDPFSDVGGAGPSSVYCGCCPCCGRCGKLCQKWPICYMSDVIVNNGPYRQGCFGHDLSCGEQQWAADADFDSVVACIIQPVLSIVGDAAVTGGWSLAGCVAGCVWSHPSLYLTLSMFASYPCHAGNDCLGATTPWGSVATAAQGSELEMGDVNHGGYCSGGAAGTSSAPVQWAVGRRRGVGGGSDVNQCDSCQCCDDDDVQVKDGRKPCCHFSPHTEHCCGM